MNEKYGIELELIISKFKEKIDKVKQQFKGIEDQKIDIGKQINIDNKYTKRQMQELEKEVETLQKKIESKTLKFEIDTSALDKLREEARQSVLKQNPSIGTKQLKDRTELKMFSNENAVSLTAEVEKLNLEIEKYNLLLTSAKEKLNEIKSIGLNINGEQAEIETENVKNNVKQLKKELEKTKTIKLDLGNGLEKSISKIKRFALSLLSIRGIYSLLSKASSAYMSQDTALANKMQAVWVGLGAMLEPVISGIANTLLKGVKYINIFIKALTGVDLLAKAMQKSLNGTAKSAKNLNKTLAGFDELNNLDTTSDVSSSNIDTNWVNAFNDVEINTSWADKIREFGEWFKNNAPMITGLLAGLTAGVIAFKSGLSGIKSVGIGLVVTGVVKGVQDLIELIKDPSWKKFGKVVQDIGFVVLGLGMIFGNIPAIIAGALFLIVGYVIEHWDEIKEATKLLWEFIKEGFWTLVRIIEGIFTTIALIIRAPFETLWDIVKGVFDGIKTILKGIAQVFKGIFTGDIKTVLEGFKNIFKGIFDSLWSIAKAPLNLIIRGINALISGANKISFDVPDWVPGIGGKKFGFNIPKIPLLNVGTNYVPEDQLAYIHKGEAVIPKKFNSQEYFGNGNEETNSLLQTLIEKVENIEINPYTTVKDVGQATVSYVKDRQRQTGRSVFT